MPISAARVAEVAAKYESANAEPSPEAPGAPPLDGASGEGSASADAAGAPVANASPSPTEQGTPPAEAPTTAEPPGLDHEILQAKLEADRARRAAKEERRRAKEEAAQAAKERKEAAELKAKWEKLGKDGSFLEAIKESGRDPKQVYEEMTKEALQAGTPEAQIAAFKKAHDAELASIREQLEAERNARIEAEQRAQQQSASARFSSDFKRAVSDDRYAGLRDEYDEDQLEGMVASLRDNPETLFAHAEHLGVALTAGDNSYNMLDILNVMKATQDAHIARKQRRTQQAAPQPGQANPSSNPPTAKKPTVNGTAERNAGNTIGNDLAAQRATEAETLKNMSFAQRRDFLAKKYG